MNRGLSVAQGGQQQDTVGNTFGAGQAHHACGAAQGRNIQKLDVEHETVLYFWVLCEEMRQWARVSLAWSIRD